MAELFHKQESPILGIVPELPGACVIAKGDRFACLYPVDYVVWTQGVAEFAESATRYAETNFPTAAAGAVADRSRLDARDRGARRSAAGRSARSPCTFSRRHPVKPTPAPAAP